MDRCPPPRPARAGARERSRVKPARAPPASARARLASARARPGAARTGSARDRWAPWAPGSASRPTPARPGAAPAAGPIRRHRPMGDQRLRPSTTRPTDRSSVGWGSSTTASSGAAAGDGQSPQADSASRGDSGQRSPEAHASPSGSRGPDDPGDSRSSPGHSAPRSGDGRSHGPLIGGPRWVHGSPAHDSEAKRGLPLAPQEARWQRTGRRRLSRRRPT